MFKKIFAAALLMLSCSTQAELINADWKTEGDGLAFVDTRTGLVFLDLTVTAEESLVGVQSRLLDSNDLFGWSLASQGEVDSLFTTMTGKIAPSPENNTNYVFDDQPYDALTPVMDDVHGTRKYGLFYGNDGNTYMMGERPGTVYHYYKRSGESYSRDDHGLWLVASNDDVTLWQQNNLSEANDVSTPMAISLSALALGIAGFRRKK